jgi:multiple sugar transport system permease protein
LGFFILTLYPMVYTLYLSFTQFNILQPPKWIGLRNYVVMFAGNAEYPRDVRFLGSLFVTLRYVFISIPLKLVFALAVAM